MPNKDSRFIHRARLLTTSLFLAAVLAVQAPLQSKAQTEPDTAGASVEKVVGLTLSALADSEISSAEADTILSRIDTDRIAQFSLGRHWRTLDAKKQATFISAFRDFANAQLRKHLAGFANAKVETVRVIERKPGDAIVVTRVTGVQGKEQLVSWRVSKEDEWKVTDIEVMGMWFAIEQRAQFQAVLDRNGGNVQALVSQLVPQT